MRPPRASAPVGASLFGASPDRSVARGSASEGPTSEGPTSEGPTSEGPASEGPASEGPASEGPASEGLASEGPASEASRLRRELGLDGCRVLGFIGSFYAYEGLDLLVRALPEILAAAPDVRVLMVGGGSAEAAWRAEAEQIGVADKMIFTGRVPHHKVSLYYNLVDLLVYPRHSIRLTELVTPLKPLEAMAQGKILVASNVGGHQELIRDGITGYLFAADSSHALAQRVLQALAHQEAWPAMAAAGRRFVETERNWDVSVRRYGAVYESVLRGH
ncbi:MAG: glycosyltransferase [Deltaproteobacteria bacterium]|nr:glycosyltransferase [Deltaproteobacteria bacterium]